MAEKKSTVQTGELVPQPHGGALRNGGPNSGGPGRPPKTLKKLCHRRFVKHLPKIDKMLDRKRLKNADLMQAMSMFAKYGSEAAMPVTELRKRLQRQNQIIRESFDAETADRIIQAIRSAWVAG